MPDESDEFAVTGTTGKPSGAKPKKPVQKPPEDAPQLEIQSGETAEAESQQSAKSQPPKEEEVPRETGQSIVELSVFTNRAINAEALRQLALRHSFVQDLVNERDKLAEENALLKLKLEAK